MAANLKYLKYVVRHRRFVLMACRKTGASLWLGLMHDLSKFLPSEWKPYVKNFYGKPDKATYDLAWLKHQKRNKHHWQYWVLINDEDGTYPLKMPEKYVKEMVADWIGAGMAIHGRCEVCDWYENNKEKMILHPETRAIIEDVIGKGDFW